MGADGKSRETGAFAVRVAEGIIHIESQGVEATREMVAEVVAVTRDVVGDSPMPVIFDFREWPPGGRVAWDAIIGNAVAMFSAVALLVAEPAPPIGSYPEIITRLLVPVGVFTTYAEARAFVIGRSRSS